MRDFKEPRQPNQMASFAGAIWGLMWGYAVTLAGAAVVGSHWGLVGTTVACAVITIPTAIGGVIHAYSEWYNPTVKTSSDFLRLLVLSSTLGALMLLVLPTVLVAEILEKRTARRNQLAYKRAKEIASKRAQAYATERAKLRRRAQLRGSKSGLPRASITVHSSKYDVTAVSPMQEFLDGLPGVFKIMMDYAFLKGVLTNRCAHH